MSIFKPDGTKVLVGDETGLAKLVTVGAGAPQPQTWGVQTRQSGIQKLCWTGPASSPASSFCVVAKDSVVRKYDIGAPRVVRSVPVTIGANAVGCQWLPKKGLLVVAGDEGQVQGISMDNEAKNPAFSFKVPSPLSVARVDANEACIGFGGRNNDLQVWDIATTKEVFKARNVPNDNLDIPVPIWVADFHFVESLSSGGHIIVTATGHKHVRIYDTRAQRRPIRGTKFGEYPFTASAITADGKSIIVGDTTGTLSRIELGKMTVLGGYKGISGAVKAVSVHPTLPFVATAGLDRCLRVHQIESRQLCSRAYLRQKLTSAAFDTSSIAGFEAPDEDDDVWHELERRRKIASGELPADTDTKAEDGQADAADEEDAGDEEEADDVEDDADVDEEDEDEDEEDEDEDDDIDEEDDSESEEEVITKPAARKGKNVIVAAAPKRNGAPAPAKRQQPPAKAPAKPGKKQRR